MYVVSLTEDHYKVLFGSHEGAIRKQAQVKGVYSFQRISSAVNPVERLSTLNKGHILTRNICERFGFGNEIPLTSVVKSVEEGDITGVCQGAIQIEFGDTSCDELSHINGRSLRSLLEHDPVTVLPVNSVKVDVNLQLSVVHLDTLSEGLWRRPKTVSYAQSVSSLRKVLVIIGTGHQNYGWVFRKLPVARACSVTYE